MSLTYETITDLRTQLLKGLFSIKDKYHLDEAHTQSLAKDLSKVLFDQRETHPSFEKQLCEVKDTLETSIEKVRTGENSFSKNAPGRD